MPKRQLRTVIGNDRWYFDVDGDNTALEESADRDKNDDNQNTGIMEQNERVKWLSHRKLVTKRLLVHNVSFQRIVITYICNKAILFT